VLKRTVRTPLLGGVSFSGAPGVGSWSPLATGVKKVTSLTFDGEQANVRGAQTWLFISPVRETGYVIASAATGEAVALALFEVDEIEYYLSRGEEIDWSKVYGAEGRPNVTVTLDEFNAAAASSSKNKQGIAYSNIVDHWLVSDGMYFWIAATLQVEMVDGNSEDGNTIVVDTGVGVARIMLSTSWFLGTEIAYSTKVNWIYDRAYDPDDSRDSITTQDLWAVQRAEGGIAIGVVRGAEVGDLKKPPVKGKKPPGNTRYGRTLRIILVSATNELDDLVGLWEDLAIGVGNGGSATYDPSNKNAPYRLLLTQNIDTCNADPLQLLEVRDDWTVYSQDTRFLSTNPKAEEYAFSMATEADLGGGYWAVVVRRQVTNDDLIDNNEQYQLEQSASACVYDHDGNPDTRDDNPYSIADDFSAIIVVIIDPDGNPVDGTEVELTNVYADDGTPQVGCRPHIVRVDDDTLYIAYDGAYREGGVLDQSGNDVRSLWIAKLKYSVPDSSTGTGGYSGRTPPDWWSGGWNGPDGYGGRTPPSLLGLKRTLDTSDLNTQSPLLRPLELMSVREPPEFITVGQSPVNLVTRPTDDCLWCEAEQEVLAVPTMLAQATPADQVDFLGRRVEVVNDQVLLVPEVIRRLGAG